MLNEVYNIHDFISFELINELKLKCAFNRMNNEYHYFAKKNNNQKSSFIIKVVDKISATHLFDYKVGRWKLKIDLGDLGNKTTVLKIAGHTDGFRKLIKYSALKNLYVRPLLSYKFIQAGKVLVHSCGFAMNKGGHILAGRPGVFKTSILMDMIRLYNAEFLGDENVLIYNKKVFSFPLNIKSFRCMMIIRDKKRINFQS